MIDFDLSRRQFLARVDAAAKASLLALSLPAILGAGARARAAQAAGAAFVTLGAAEAEAFAAIAARIIPTDETPGATEAGAVHFMDRVLGAERADVLPALREGLAGLEARAVERFGAGPFAALPEARQDALLTEIEDGAFFATLRYLTIAGTFSLPVYGGNRDGVGWQLIGFEHRHMWMPPYGFYDADHAAKGA